MLEEITNRSFIIDWSEVSSVGTLRSASLRTPSVEPHLPSYLSLACTVNGYSTTTNYDPVRLSKSRDASPHRFDHDLTPKNQAYSVQNNLLSPPNLVPLPTHIKHRMSDNTIATHQHHQEFYKSTKTMTLRKESNFATFLGKDTIDACFENGQIKHQCVSLESNTYTASVNGKSKLETSVKELSTSIESKSFIEQRVERLYGPGALAQGFFVSKKQKNRDSDSFNNSLNVTYEDIVENGDGDISMKQSSSSPALPVLRHLRPEFRAQLPIITNRKSGNGVMQKSNTVPDALKEEGQVNGHSKTVSSSCGTNLPQNTIAEESGKLLKVATFRSYKEKVGGCFLWLGRITLNLWLF